MIEFLATQKARDERIAVGHSALLMDRQRKNRSRNYSTKIRGLKRSWTEEKSK